MSLILYTIEVTIFGTNGTAEAFLLNYSNEFPKPSRFFDSFDCIPKEGERSATLMPSSLAEHYCQKLGAFKLCEEDLKFISKFEFRKIEVEFKDF